jgi:hypothetical protein
VVCSSGMEVESAWAARGLRSHSAGMRVYKMASLSAGNWLLSDLRRSLIVSTVNGPASFAVISMPSEMPSLEVARFW